MSPAFGETCFSMAMIASAVIFRLLRSANATKAAFSSGGTSICNTFLGFPVPAGRPDFFFLSMSNMLTNSTTKGNTNLP